MSRWGNAAPIQRQGKDKIMLKTTKIFTNSGNYKIPDPKILLSFLNQKFKLEITFINATNK